MEYMLPEKIKMAVEAKVHHFRELAVVRHRNGTEYIVVQTPDTCRIEAGDVPAYAYRENGPQIWTRPQIWIRPQTEMEDGRFELVG